MLNGAPAAVFDCVFTAGPAGRAPVLVRGKGQRVVASENAALGAGAVFAGSGLVYAVPAGKLSGSLASARQSFLTDAARTPARVDARP